MVRAINAIRVTVELLCGAALIIFIGGLLLYAAFVVGWAMALGVSIVFVLEFIHRIRHNS